MDHDKSLKDLKDSNLEVVTERKTSSNNSVPAEDIKWEIGEVWNQDAQDQNLNAS